MGKFLITKRANGEFQFVLKADNGQTILSSEGYANRTGCENGIESVRKNASDDDRYERKTASDNRDYFVLKAGNGQVIGTSQMYQRGDGMENGIDSVKTNAPKATVEEDI